MDKSKNMNFETFSVLTEGDDLAIEYKDGTHVGDARELLPPKQQICVHYFNGTLIISQAEILHGEYLGAMIVNKTIEEAMKEA